MLLRSLDDALALARRLRNVLGSIAALALCVAFAGAWRLASGLSRPVERLVELSRKLGTGLLDARATVEGPRETRVLGASLNQMAKELQACARVAQGAILPRSPEVPGLEVAAHMQPASEVGGDYYDLHPTPDGAWIAAVPSTIIGYLNELICLNVKDRLGELEHVTFVLLHYQEDGRVTYAGAHEELIVYRAHTQRGELIPTRGMWLGPARDITGLVPDRTLQLEPGDLLVHYTDGIPESMNSEQRVYDLDRLCEQIERAANSPVSEICDRVFADVAAYCPVLEDDRTLLVLRQIGARA